MALPDFNDLFERARRSAELTPTDRRRAISDIYYGLFHFILTAATDRIVTDRTAKLYELVYRSVRHAHLRELCKQIQKSALPEKLQPYKPTSGFGPLLTFAATVESLQELRHKADYDPLFTAPSADEITTTIERAKHAIVQFDSASEAQKTTFITLLLFKPVETKT